MNPIQWQWLNKVAGVIPELFKRIERGQSHTEWTLGLRHINGKHVRLSLVAEVVDAGANPLQSHASVNYPSRDIQKPENMTVPMPRHRKRSKRW